LRHKDRGIPRARISITLFSVSARFVSVNGCNSLIMISITATAVENSIVKGNLFKPVDSTVIICLTAGVIFMINSLVLI
jgi:hypothetical protein